MQNISSAQFEGIYAHLFGDDFHLRLKREHDLRTARRARLGARNLIGIRAISLAADRRDSIHARQAPPSEHRHLRIRFLRAVSAAAKVNDPLDRRESSVLCDSRAQIDHCGMAVTAGEKLFGVIENEFNGFSICCLR